MKESIKLLRDRAYSLRHGHLAVPAPGAERQRFVSDYEGTAELLEQLSKGDLGPNQVQVVTQENTVLNAENLLTAALFVGINPKAAHNLVELVKYIQRLEEAVDRKRSEDVG